MKFKYLFVLAISAAGLLGFYYLNQQDVGLTAVLLITICFAYGFVAHSRAWLWGIFIGCGIPAAMFLAASFDWTFWDIINGSLSVWRINFDQAMQSLVTLPVAVASSLLGTAIRRLVGLNKDSPESETQKRQY